MARGLASGNSSLGRHKTQLGNQTGVSQVGNRFSLLVAQVDRTTAE